MDLWCLSLQLPAWTLMSLCVFSLEVTVRNSDLMLCDDQRVCVTEPRDCGARPASAEQRTLNVSCSFQMSSRSVTCEWSQESDGLAEPHASLIFSNGRKIITCRGIFNPAAVVDVTARTTDVWTGAEVWSQRHTVVLYDAIRPRPPVLSVCGCTEDSVTVCWSSSADGGCRLRYRAENTHIWTEAVDVVDAREGRTLTFTIRELQPFTAYRAAASCRERVGFWSKWSAGVSATTLDRAPSRPPEVCYRVEKAESAGFSLLHLVFKDVDLGGRILGYQVSYEPVKKKKKEKEEGGKMEVEVGRQIQNATGATALLVVEEGNCTVSLAAFNTAGFGPAAHLSIDTQRHGDALPSVRHLWVSSSFPETRGLLVQWEEPPPSTSTSTSASTSALPVSHYAVQWRSVARPSSSRSTTSFSTSAVIRDVVGPDESYLVTVLPVYSRQCGSPQSLPASLQQGAMMEAVGMKVASVTKTTVTAVWAWQKKSSGSIRVSRYRAMLKEPSGRQTVFLWPDQQQHTFVDLQPNTDYSLLLLADDVPTSSVHLRTDFDELPAVAAATPLLLLAAAVFITSILSRTVYKSYFFPPVCSPRRSTAGQWLMDPNLQKQHLAEGNILDVEVFQVMDVLGGKSLITVGRSSSEEDLHEDASPPSATRLLQQDAAYVCDAISPPEAPQQREAALKWDLFGHHCVCELPCEDQYVLSSSLVVDGGAEAGRRSSELVCDTDYVANSFCAAEDGGGTSR